MNTEASFDNMSHEAAIGLVKLYYQKLRDTERRLDSLRASMTAPEDIEISGGHIFRLIPPD